MMTFLIIYAVISFIALLFIIYLMLIAPEGWEDKKGFHYMENKK